MNWNLDNALKHLKSNAYSHEDVMAHKVKTGHCAQKTREAIEAGGLVLTRHNSAKDYGHSLRSVGFGPVFNSPLAGDVVIIQPVTGHPHGHMAMFNGTRWVSDFVQNDIWPGSAYRKAKPAYTIFRHGAAARYHIKTSTVAVGVRG